MNKKQYKDVNWNYLTCKPGVQWWALVVVVVSVEILYLPKAEFKFGSWWISVQLSCLFHFWKTCTLALDTIHKTNTLIHPTNRRVITHAWSTWKLLIIKHKYGMITNTSRNQSVLSICFVHRWNWICAKIVHTRLSLDFNWEAHCSFPLLLE